MRVKTRWEEWLLDMPEDRAVPCVWVVEGEYEPYTPARLSGPPEDCYPAEGGYAEITEGYCEELGIYLDGSEMHKRFGEKGIEQIEQRLADVGIQREGRELYYDSEADGDRRRLNLFALEDL